MRQWINIVNEEINGISLPFDGIVYHCSNDHIEKFIVYTNRGIYFANEPDTDYGKYTYKCRVKIKNAKYNLTGDNFEIDRNKLIAKGYDGRIVDYKEESEYEMYDVIAFYPEQIEILEVTNNQTNKPLDEDAESDTAYSRIAEQILIKLYNYLYTIRDTTKTASLILASDVPGLEMLNDTVFLFSNKIKSPYHLEKQSPVDGISHVIGIKSDPSIPAIMGNIFGAHRRDFVHEVTHLLDAKRFKGNRFKSVQASGKNSFSTSENGTEDYHNSPFELNAYFHEIAEPLLRILRAHQEDPEMMAFETIPPATFQEFLNNRVEHLSREAKRHWKNVSEPNKRQIIKRLFGLYNAAKACFPNDGAD